MPEKKKRGRPRKYANDAERIKRFRERKKHDSRRVDAYINTKASWRLDKLAEAWGCSTGQAIKRLIMEADERYESILFPDLTLPETNNDQHVETVDEVTPAIIHHDWDADEKKFTDDIEASKYRRVQLFAESGYTYGVIAQKLTFEGFPPLKGKTRWTAQTVKSILKKGQKNG